MDNCSIHNIDEVTLQQTGHLQASTILSYYNPIEAFSKAESMMKAMEIKMQLTQDIDTIVYAAFSAITPDD